jgi:hypothetical protein
MATVDTLPADQRAVLSLVLDRGLAYDQIAKLLKLDPAAIRGRALAALAALGPADEVGATGRAELSDYLLGQLSGQAAQRARAQLAASPLQLRWARSTARELAALSSAPLESIPWAIAKPRAFDQAKLVWLERVAIAAASLGLAVLLIALMSGYFAGHDAATVSGTVTVGLRFADQGDGALTAGYPAPVYDSSPPTSGPHTRRPVQADDQQLGNSQILTALAAGDVVIFYGSSQPSGALRALAGPFSPTLARIGDAVILARRPGTAGLIALAWTRMLKVRAAGDPLLEVFIEARLGRGAAAT